MANALAFYDKKLIASAKRVCSVTNAPAFYKIELTAAFKRECHCDKCSSIL
jgi:hypothetical protein